MRILVCSFTTPTYAPSEFAHYLESTGHEFQLIQVPAKHERRFIPGLSHLANIRQIGREVEGEFDLAVAPDPAFMLALNELKKKGRVAKTVYWRLDYFPRKYPGPFDKAYQWLERNAVDTADEVWSMADPSIPYVRDSLRREALHVPYLFHKIGKVTPDRRVNSAMWMGPDLDGSRQTCVDATNMAGLPFAIADYSEAKYRLSEHEMNRFLNATTVGLALYRPDRWKPWPDTPPRSSKYYCDSARIRRFLAHGVPVITTDVAPTHTTVRDFAAGWVIPTCDVELVKNGIEYCLEHFDRLSENAYKAAAAFTYPAWFKKHHIL